MPAAHYALTAPSNYGGGSRLRRQPHGAIGAGAGGGPEPCFLREYQLAAFEKSTVVEYAARQNRSALN